MWKLLLATSLGLLLLTSVACAARAAPKAGEGVSSEESQLMRLVERLFTRPPGVPDGGKPSILPGELPPDFDVPVPEGTEVVGSVVYGEKSAQVVLDVPGQPQDVLAFFRGALAEKGWREQERPGPQEGGFVYKAAGALIPVVFCPQSGDRSISVNAYASQQEGLADVRLMLSSGEEYSPCEEDFVRPEPPYGRIFPPLTAPEGVEQHGGGGGGGGREAYTSADLTTTLSASEVEAHYSEQLLAAGWERLNQGSTDPLAWSTWRFSDERGREWGAVLPVIATPGAEDSLFAYLRAVRSG